jgi:hypothetical protein
VKLQAQSLQAIIPNVTDALQDKATLPKLAELQLSLSSIAAIMFGAPTPTVQRPLSKPPSIIPPMQYAFPRNSTTQFSFPDAETSIMPLDSMITDDTEIRRLCRRFGSVVIGHVIAIFNNDLDAQHEEFDPFFVERAYNDIVSVQQVTSASDTSTRIGLATVIRGYQSLSNLPYEVRVRISIQIEAAYPTFRLRCLLYQLPTLLTLLLASAKRCSSSDHARVFTYAIVDSL